ncbi:carbohydrate kinase [Faecalibacterium sp.]|uniref:carbohydrate kinase family protein n=1 Tax=Faecalibacterium sp. TaxID=1971605 RepID=UPI0025C13ACB|nr:carbohydrate kinase [Faecalibacterium sp.]
MFDVVALGESLIDFTPNGTNPQGIELFARNPGGAPANVLAMNARLGGKTAFIGKVGKDGFGDFLRQTLVESSIDVSGLVIDEKIPTTLAFVQLDSKGDRSFTFYRNPGADVMLTSAEVNRNLIDDAAIFHFGSVSLTSDPSRTATLEAARYARQQGKLVSFDPNYRPLLWEHPADAVVQMQEGVKLADLLKVSEEEMQLITNESDLARGSQALLEMGPSLVLVSLGAKGAYYRNAVGAGHLPTYDVPTVDTTGAGDAFMGAIHYQLRRKAAEDLRTLPAFELEEIVRFGNAAGSLTTTKGGAIPAMPSMVEIQNCIASIPLM